MAKVILLDVLGAPIAYEVLKRSLKKEGIDCEVISFQKEMEKGIKISRSQGTYTPFAIPKAVNAMRSKLKELRPKLSKATAFGITFYDYELSSDLLVPFSRALKEEYPQKPLVGGGPAFNTNPKGFFKDAMPDYAIKGEAENSFPRLIKAIAQRNKTALETIPGVIRRTSQGITVPKLPVLLGREEIAKGGIVFTRTTKNSILTYTERGCPYACVFCSVMRRGRPVTLSDEEIIKGLKTMGKNPEIKTIHFVDDNLFYDKNRVYRLFGKIIQEGLAKRFTFQSMATVTAFLTKDKRIDLPFMNFLRKAHFTGFTLGTEALNDNILRELKRAPYNSIEAIKVNDALRKMKFKTANFMLAGGIDTRAIDFVESYYRAMAKNTRQSGEYYNFAMLRGYREDPYYKRAEKEGAVVNLQGSIIPSIETENSAPRMIIPKDPHLKTLFTEAMQLRHSAFGEPSMPQVLLLTKKLAEEEPKAKQAYRRLQKLSGTITAQNRGINNTVLFFANCLAVNHLKKQGLKRTNENYEKLARDKKSMDKIFKKSRILAKRYYKQTQAAEKLRGIKRLKTIQRIRKQTGLGLEALGIISHRR